MNSFLKLRGKIHSLFQAKQWGVIVWFGTSPVLGLKSRWFYRDSVVKWTGSNIVGLVRSALVILTSVVLVEGKRLT